MIRARKLCGIAILLITWLFVHANPAQPPVREGTLQVTGGKIWYRVVGSGKATPLLLLHGGPGMPAYYLEPLSALANERPVIFYDQLGCGRSDRPDNPALWTVERFVKELAQVRKELHLEKIHLLGHSWGSMLATEYMLTHPKGVVSLILAGPAISCPRWLQDANKLRSQLPAEVQETLARNEKAGTTDSKEYQDATMQFYKRHFCRVDPFPSQVENTFANAGLQVYNTMWGPSEFFATGILKNFDRSSRLKEIKAPTLFTCGRYDEATPETTAWYQSLLPGSKLVVFENSSHLTMIEEPDHYVQVIRDFLKEVETQKTTRTPS